MKKLCSILFAFLLCFAGMSSVSAEAPDYTLHTDILAYVNGAPIRSCNIAGFTGIVAEDLMQYGFGVYYDDSSRTLEVIKLNNNVTATYVPEPVSAPVGSPDKKIYATDIKTYVNGNLVDSFNIGGQTIIFIDDLICFGQVVWYPEERKICYNHVENWSLDLHKTDYNSDLSQPVNSFTLNWEKTADGWKSYGENLDCPEYLKLNYSWQNGIRFSFSLYQRTLSQAEGLYNLLGSMVTVRYNGEVVSETADVANEHMKIYINDVEQKIVNVYQGRGNGHIDYEFCLDTQIAKEDIVKVTVVCQ